MVRETLEKIKGKPKRKGLSAVTGSLLFLIACGLVACSGAEVSGEPSLETTAIEAQVWVTTPDKSKLLEPQPGVMVSSGSLSGATITVDASQTFQQIEGFGAALTDSSAWLIDNALSPGQRTELLEDLFAPVRGAGLSYVRLPMGASDFALEHYTYNDLPSGQTDPDQSQFSIAHDESYILPVAREILQANPAVKFMGSPWSAPAWMKDSGSLNGGKLNPEYYESYATYFTKFVQAYAAAGVPVDAVTLQNEPHHTADYPSMRMEPGDQADFVKELGPAFDAAGIDTKILVFDHNWDEPNYPVEVMNDGAARPYIDGSAFHCYLGEVSAQSQTHAAYPDKGLYFTECSGGEWATDFGANLAWNTRNLIIGSTRNWAKTALLWNLALDENNGPKTAGGCDTCRGVVTITGAGEVTYNEEYYVLGHAGKVVQPGAYRVASDALAGTVESVAFRNPDGSRALITLNTGQTSQTFNVSEGERYFSYTLPAGAVASFKWSGDTGDGGDDGGDGDGDDGGDPQPPTPDPTDAFSKLQAETYSDMRGVRLVEEGTAVGWTDGGDFVAFDRVDFGAGAGSVTVRVATATEGGTLEFRRGSEDGALLGSVRVSDTGGWNTWTTESAAVSGASGTFDLYLVFKGPTSGGIMNLDWLEFSQASGSPGSGAGSALPRSGWQARASSSAPDDPPGNALDGDPNTRWSTGQGQGDNAFEVDMRSPRTFRRVVMDAGSSTGDYPRRYEVYVSNDRTTWQRVATGRGSAQRVEATFPAQTARYLRLVQTGSAGNWWSLHELNVYD